MGSIVSKNVRALEDLAKLLKNLENVQVATGILQEEGAQMKGGISISEIANIHEFGIGVPQRSFVRKWASLNAEKNRKLASEISQRCIKSRNIRDLYALPAIFKADMQLFISEKRVSPPLSEETIRRKKSSTPLIDTGQLRSSIRGAIRFTVAGPWEGKK